MARKNLLDGLMGPGDDDPPAPKPKTDPDARVNVSKPRYSGGAIGAVSQSIAGLKSKSVIDIDPHKIEQAGLEDRLEYDDASHAQLVESLRDYGQQVPVLVRPHPEKPDTYQVVYGRRRVLALRDLGIPAKAMVKELDDRALIVAQGQENSARKDLTFIEKARFALRMQQDGFKRKVICDALSVDKTAISKMLSIVEKIDPAIIRAIGPADGVGRDRWATFASRLEQSDRSASDIANAILDTAEVAPGVERFDLALRAIGQDQAMKTKVKPPAPKPEMITSVGGRDPIAKVTRKPDTLTLSIDRSTSGGFDDWLVANLRSLHAEWEDHVADVLAGHSDDPSRNTKP